MIQNIRSYIALMAAVLLLFSCAKDEAQGDSQPVPIQLTATGIGTGTRAADGINDTNFPASTPITVAVDGTNYSYQTDATSVSNPMTCLAAIPPHFPVSGNSVHIVAYYPALMQYATTAQTFTVAADQSTEANYKASDLMVGLPQTTFEDANHVSLIEGTGFTRKVKPTSLNIPMEFEHKLVKIKVVVTINGAVVKKVTMKNVMRSIDFNPSDGTFAALSLASASDGLGDNVIIYDNSTGTSADFTCAAIIPEQNPAAATEFIDVIIQDSPSDKTLTYKLQEDGGFESGKQYIYNLTVNNDEILCTSSITSWGSGVNANVTSNKTVLIGRPKLPIEYVAQYNLASPTSFAADNKAISSMYFSWNNSSATTGGAASGPKSDIAKMIKGTAISGYHLPSGSEWFAILPNRNYGEGLVENNEETVAWGVTNNNGTYIYDVNRAFFNDYYFPSGTIGYGLRFKETAGNDSYENGIYTCAYRYQFQSNDPAVDDGSHQCASLTIKVKYVGPNQNTTISTISDETWWASPDFTVVLPACGFGTRNIADNRDPGFFVTLGRPATGWYWGANSISNDNAACIDFQDYRVVGSRGDEPGFPFPIRLFKDVATP